MDSDGMVSITELASNAGWTEERTLDFVIKHGYPDTVKSIGLDSQAAESLLRRIDMQRRYGAIVDTVNLPTPARSIEEVRATSLNELLALGKVSAVFADEDDRGRKFFLVLTEDDPTKRTDLPPHLEGYALITRYGGVIRACGQMG